MQFTARPSGPLRGVARVPGDKSISHRALILGALADGVTEVGGLLEGEDVLATAEAMRAFGAHVERLGDGRWRIEGRGGLVKPAGTIDCGNSGTGARLIMGAAAGFPIEAAFDGDASLRTRPMKRVLDPLREMGASVIRDTDGKLPLTIRGGALKAISYRLPVASAQVKSAILLAGLNAAGVTTVIEPHPSRDHTENMIRRSGAAAIAITDGADGARTITLTPHGRFAGLGEFSVPADPSSAAFPLVAALIAPGSDITIPGVLMNPLRAGLIETLREMGANIEIVNPRNEAGEPVADLRARHSRLKAITVPPARAPSMIDEYPILAVAAAFAQGDMIMRGIGELRVKESDRIALMARGLKNCGVRVEEEREGLIVRGAPLAPVGGHVATKGDHRIAMSHLVLGLASQGPVTVEDAEMIATSFPGFAELMRGLGAEIDT
ncbi:MAG TPA: 3-phosphoshikimate 1-carboxyvinyltransferase [Caulobacterales bacterium]|nr:3-phosphoshikimate 1-carboxyvinyltransferase [Caulobacterales bacterium]